MGSKTTTKSPAKPKNTPRKTSAKTKGKVDGNVATTRAGTKNRAEAKAEIAPAAAAEAREAKSATKKESETTRKRSTSKQKGAGKAEVRQKNSSTTKTSSRTSATAKPKTNSKPVRSSPKTRTKAAQNKKESGKKSASSATYRNFSFAKGEFVVYPPHGVGKVLSITKEAIAGSLMEMLVIEFERDKLILRIPLPKLENVGLRKLSEKKVVQKAMETLRSRPQIKRTMWSRRSQEYNAKINSGDLISIAEVTRDLFRPRRQPEQSYSERQIYEMARDRIVQEIAVIQSIKEQAALETVEDTLQQAHGSATKKAG